MNCAYKIHWTEFERGWGCRPDGTTVHIDKATADKFIENFFIKEHDRNPSGKVPDIYTNPDSPVLCEVPDDIFKRLQTEPSFWWHNTRYM